MNKASFIFAVLMLVMIGCDNNVAKPEDDNSLDEQLILAIQKSSNKMDISVDQLPAVSKTILDQDYSDLVAINALIVRDLGYETAMGGTGDKVGFSCNVYFNLDGRELKPGRGDKGGKGRGKDEWKCFKLVYPVTFNMPDGSTITIANESGYADLRAWYDANPGTDVKPEMQYPVEIDIKGTVKTINNEDEMHRVYRFCGGRDNDRYVKHRECFELVYPATFIMPDGSTIPVADKDDWLNVKAWYTDHPDSQERPGLQFPVDIKYRDGALVTINNDDEMRAAKADCERDGGGRP